MYNIIKTPIINREKSDGRLNPDSPQKEAARLGLVRFKGKPCGKNHSGWRYTKGGTCIECIQEIKNRAINPRQRSNKNHLLSIEAAKNGQVTYIPEKPCKYGHQTRYVNSNNCVECDKLQAIKHKTNAKFSRITKLYGLSKEEYLSIVKLQNSKCKLCELYFLDHFKLHVDHCHDTGKVRGLLCLNCNSGIGGLKHSPELIRKAALYCEAL